MQEAKQQSVAQAVQSTFTIRGRIVNPWLALASLVFGLFMALLDATIVNIAIPAIQTGLKTDLTSVSWVINAYNLVFAVLLITIGRLADQHGRKRLFQLGMVLFSLGSLSCALSPEMSSLTGISAINWLIGSRAAQAVGAAALTPISMAIMMAVFPQRLRGAAIGVWGAIAGLATAVGPVLGGFLIQALSWHWIFFVNLPICMIGLVMVALFVPETHDAHGSKHIDIPGVLTLSVAVFCCVLAIIEGNSWGWLSAPILSLFGATLVGLVFFVIAEMKQDEPIVDFGLFKLVSFTGASVTMFLIGIGMQGAFLITVLYFINARGYTQLNAAYALLPIPLASLVISVIAGRLSQRINAHLIGMAGVALTVIGFALLSVLGTNAAYIDIAWRSIFLGVGTGMAFQGLPNISLEYVPSVKLGVGSGVFNTFRQIGFTLGVAVLISIFVGQLQVNLTQAESTSIALVRADTTIPIQMRNSIVAALQQTTNSQSSSSSGESTSSGSGNSFDLTTLVNKLPPRTPEQTKAAMRADLSRLNGAIQDQYQTQVVDTFKMTWLVSALFTMLGLIAAIVTFVARRRDPQQQRLVEQESVGAALG
ncbi:MAG TPA: DHA2 family efflux MFS transporter permease subunit [Ktedonobacteraceae bacterium]